MCFIINIFNDISFISKKQQCTDSLNCENLSLKEVQQKQLTNVATINLGRNKHWTRNLVDFWYIYIRVDKAIKHQNF